MWLKRAIEEFAAHCSAKGVPRSEYEPLLLEVEARVRAHIRLIADRTIAEYRVHGSRGVADMHHISDRAARKRRQRALQRIGTATVISGSDLQAVYQIGTVSGGDGSAVLSSVAQTEGRA